MTAYDVAFATIHANEPDTKLAKQLANAVVEALTREGWISHDDDALALMKALRSRIKSSVMDDDCPPRDLASLSRRLQDLNADILAQEDRLREEGRLKKRDANTGAESSTDDGRTDRNSGSDRKFDPTKV